MATCNCPGCFETDSTGDEQMYLERFEDDTWIAVCDRHADHESNPTVRLTEDVKDIPVGTLTQIVADLR